MCFYLRCGRGQNMLISLRPLNRFCLGFFRTPGAQAGASDVCHGGLAQLKA